MNESRSLAMQQWANLSSHFNFRLFYGSGLPLARRSTGKKNDWERSSSSLITSGGNFRTALWVSMAYVFSIERFFRCNGHQYLFDTYRYGLKDDKRLRDRRFCDCRAHLPAVNQVFLECGI
jgi:hypothetical protein